MRRIPNITRNTRSSYTTCVRMIHHHEGNDHHHDTPLRATKIYKILLRI